ncbi:NAD(P)-dependent oxidoreductase [soil metagenome]
MTINASRRILLTGAAGRIGTAFYAEFQNRYWFRLADHKDEIKNRPLAADHESVVVDIAEPDRLLAACDGIDTVVHLAADPSPEADFHGSLLQNNFAGTYNVFRAAADSGCRRVIFASSVHAVLGYPDTEPVLESAPVWPVNMYGVSKCFGEATARKFASSDGLSSIAIRIGAYEAPWIAENPAPIHSKTYISPRDLNQLLCRCIDIETLTFAILHGGSNNRQKRLSIAETRRLVGYEPLDDGFEKYGL